MPTGDWVASVETTNYIFGTAAGPHPFPAMVRDFQKIIGEEARAQLLDEVGRLPDAVVACVGGGSNAIGMFDAFLDDEGVKLYGVRAAGDGVDTEKHAASIERGRPGVLHGAKTYVLQNEDGQTIESHSISAGLDYPGVGPEHSWLADIGRAEYIPATDDEAMQALRLLSRTEGIIPAIESAHALAGALRIGRDLGPDGLIAICLSGRGDKDMDTAARYFELYDRSRSRARRRRRERGRRDGLEGGASAMSRVEQAIQRAQDAGRSAFVGYLPVGFPDLETSIQAAIALAENGVDIIELGPPYSDPVMDGAIIQEATTTALAAGFRMADLFTAIRAITAATGVPVLVMTYWNPVMQYGVDRYADDLLAAGGAGAHHTRHHPRRGRGVDRRQ